MATPKFSGCQRAGVVIASAFRAALACPRRVGAGGAAVLLAWLDRAGTSRMRAFVAGHGISRCAHIGIPFLALRWIHGTRRCLVRIG